MTSLSRQLSALRTETVVGSREKSRPSFLFSAREAADYDNAAIFAMGVNGHTALVALCPVHFSTFSDDLFSEGWSDLDRELVSPTQAAAIGSRVAAWARAASPLFPLLSVHKALEWLIRRFKAHVYDIDALMELSLPHCETAAFGRLVQLLELGSSHATLGSGSSSAPLWHWLEPNQRNGAPCSLEILSRQCLKDQGVLRFVCQTAMSTCTLSEASSSSPSRNPSAVWLALVASNVVMRSPTASREGLLSILLPYAVACLGKGRGRDLGKAGCVIISVLLGTSDRCGSAVSAGVISKVSSALASSIAVGGDDVDVLDCLNLDDALSTLAGVFSSQAQHQAGNSGALQRGLESDFSTRAYDSISKDKTSSSGSSSSRAMEVEAGEIEGGRVVGHRGDDDDDGVWLSTFPFPQPSALQLISHPDFCNALSRISSKVDVGYLSRSLLTSATVAVLRGSESAETTVSALPTLLSSFPHYLFSSLFPAYTQHIITLVQESIASSHAATRLLAPVLKRMAILDGSAVESGISMWVNSLEQTEQVGPATSHTLTWIKNSLAGTSLITFSLSLPPGVSGSVGTGNVPVENGGLLFGDFLSIQTALRHQSVQLRLSAVETGLAHELKTILGGGGASKQAQPRDFSQVFPLICSALEDKHPAIVEAAVALLATSLDAESLRLHFYKMESVWGGNSGSQGGGSEMKVLEEEEEEEKEAEKVSNPSLNTASILSRLVVRWIPKAFLPLPALLQTYVDGIASLPSSPVSVSLDTMEEAKAICSARQVVFGCCKILSQHVLRNPPSPPPPPHAGRGLSKTHTAYFYALSAVLSALPLKGEKITQETVSSASSAPLIPSVLASGGRSNPRRKPSMSSPGSASSGGSGVATPSFCYTIPLTTSPDPSNPDSSARVLNLSVLDTQYALLATLSTSTNAEGRGTVELVHGDPLLSCLIGLDNSKPACVIHALSEALWRDECHEKGANGATNAPSSSFLPFFTRLAVDPNVSLRGRTLALLVLHDTLSYQKMQQKREKPKAAAPRAVAPSLVTSETQPFNFPPSLPLALSALFLQGGVWVDIVAGSLQEKSSPTPLESAAREFVLEAICDTAASLSAFCTTDTDSGSNAPTGSLSKAAPAKKTTGTTPSHRCGPCEYRAVLSKLLQLVLSTPESTALPWSPTLCQGPVRSILKSLTLNHACSALLETVSLSFPVVPWTSAGGSLSSKAVKDASSSSSSSHSTASSFASLSAARALALLTQLLTTTSKQQLPRSTQGGGSSPSLIAFPVELIPRLLVVCVGALAARLSPTGSGNLTASSPLTFLTANTGGVLGLLEGLCSSLGDSGIGGEVGGSERGSSKAPSKPSQGITDALAVAKAIVLSFRRENGNSTLPSSTMKEEGAAVSTATQLASPPFAGLFSPEQMSPTVFSALSNTLLPLAGELSCAGEPSAPFLFSYFQSSFYTSTLAPLWPSLSLVLTSFSRYFSIAQEECRPIHPSLVLSTRSLLALSGKLATELSAASSSTAPPSSSKEWESSSPIPGDSTSSISHSIVEGALALFKSLGKSRADDFHPHSLSMGVALGLKFDALTTLKIDCLRIASSLRLWALTSTQNTPSSGDANKPGSTKALKNAVSHTSPLTPPSHPSNTHYSVVLCLLDLIVTSDFSSSSLISSSTPQALISAARNSFLRLPIPSSIIILVIQELLSLDPGLEPSAGSRKGSKLVEKRPTSSSSSTTARSFLFLDSVLGGGVSSPLARTWLNRLNRFLDALSSNAIFHDSARTPTSHSGGTLSITSSLSPTLLIPILFRILSILEALTEQLTERQHSVKQLLEELPKSKHSSSSSSGDKQGGNKLDDDGLLVEEDTLAFAVQSTLTLAHEAVKSVPYFGGSSSTSTVAYPLASIFQQQIQYADPSTPLYFARLPTATTATRAASLLLLSILAMHSPENTLHELLHLATFSLDSRERKKQQQKQQQHTDDTFTYTMLARCADAIFAPLCKFGPSMGIPPESLILEFSRKASAIPHHRALPLFQNLVLSLSAAKAFTASSPVKAPSTSSTASTPQRSSEQPLDDSIGATTPTAMPSASATRMTVTTVPTAQSKADKAFYLPHACVYLLAQSVFEGAAQLSASEEGEDDIASLQSHRFFPPSTLTTTPRSKPSTTETESAGGLGGKNSITSLVSRLLSGFSSAQQITTLATFLGVARGLLAVPILGLDIFVGESLGGRGVAGASSSGKSSKQQQAVHVKSGKRRDVECGMGEEEGEEEGEEVEGEEEEEEEGEEGMVFGVEVNLRNSVFSPSQTAASLLPHILHWNKAPLARFLAASSKEKPPQPPQTQQATNENCALPASMRFKLALFLLQYTVEHLSGREFLSTTIAPSGSVGVSALQRIHLALAEQVFFLLQLVNAGLEKSERQQSENTTNTTTSSTKASSALSSLSFFWEKANDLCFDVVSQLGVLLAPPAFIAVVSELLTHSDSRIRLRALLFLEDHLLASTTALPLPPSSSSKASAAQARLSGGRGGGGNGGGVSEGSATSSGSDSPLYLALLPILEKICYTSNAPVPPTVSSSPSLHPPEPLVNKIAALGTASLLARFFGGSYPSHFTSFLKISCPLAAASSEEPSGFSGSSNSISLRAAAILSSTSILCFMGPSNHSLAFLPSLLPTLLNCLQECVQGTVGDTTTTTPPPTKRATATSSNSESTHRIDLDLLTPLLVNTLHSLAQLVSTYPAFLNPILAPALTFLFHPSIVGPLPLPQTYFNPAGLLTVNDSGLPCLVESGSSGGTQKQVVQPAVSWSLPATVFFGIPGGALAPGTYPSGETGVRAVPGGKARPGKQLGEQQQLYRDGTGVLASKVRSAIVHEVEARLVFTALLGAPWKTVLDSRGAMGTSSSPAGAPIAHAPPPSSSKKLKIGGAHKSPPSTVVTPQTVCALLDTFTRLASTCDKRLWKQNLPALISAVLTACDLRWMWAEVGAVELVVGVHHGGVEGGLGYGKNPVIPVTAARVNNNDNAFEGAFTSLSSSGVMGSCMEVSASLLFTALAVRCSPKEAASLLASLHAWARATPQDISGSIADEGQVSHLVALPPSHVIWSFAALARRISYYRCLDTLMAVGKTAVLSLLKGTLLLDISTDVPEMDDAQQALASATASLASLPASNKGKEETFTSKKRPAVKKIKEKLRSRKSVRFSGDDMNQEEEEEEEEDEEEEEEEEDAATRTAGGGVVETGGSRISHNSLLFTLRSLNAVYNSTLYQPAPSHPNRLSFENYPLSSTLLPTSPHALTCSALSTLTKVLLLDSSQQYDPGMSEAPPGGSEGTPSDAPVFMIAPPKHWSASSAALSSLSRERLDLVLRPILASLKFPLAVSSVGTPLPSRLLLADPVLAQGVDESNGNYFPSLPLGNLGVPGGQGGFEAFMEAYTLPAVRAATRSARSDIPWKTMLRSLLLCTRDARTRVKFAGVQAASALFLAGGDDALLLLPEALPFLSETQHDDDPRVEAATHKLISHLQTSSGEDLAKYLS